MTAKKRDQREYLRAYYAANREKLCAQNRARHAANRETANAVSRAWGMANREKANARARDWAAANPDKIRVSKAQYVQANLDKHAALMARRRAAKIHRTPVWADPKKTEKVYEEARMMTLMMDEPWHVDHVIPLRGRRVSGLHVHTNLQLLPGVENVRKNNRYELA